MYICISLSLYIYIYICISICVYIYIYIHTYTHNTYMRNLLGWLETRLAQITFNHTNNA